MSRELGRKIAYALAVEANSLVIPYPGETGWYAFEGTVAEIVVNELAKANKVKDD